MLLQPRNLIIVANIIILAKKVTSFMCQPVCCKYCFLGVTLCSGAGAAADAETESVQASWNSHTVERQETRKPRELFQILEV